MTWVKNRFFVISLFPNYFLLDFDSIIFFQFNLKFKNNNKGLDFGYSTSTAKK